MSDCISQGAEASLALGPICMIASLLARCRVLLVISAAPGLEGPGRDCSRLLKPQSKPLRVTGRLGCQWCIQPKAVINHYVQTRPWGIARKRGDRRAPSGNVEYGMRKECGETWPSHGGEHADIFFAT